jgi:nitrite reductase/ring-hydroxylating ferredoxin subunit
MSETWHSVCPAEDVQPGAMAPFEIGDLQIAIYNLDGEYFATDNICTHGYALLSDGILDNGTVECPLHGGCFDVRNGKALCEPVETDLRVYRTRLSNGSLEICVEGT